MLNIKNVTAKNFLSIGAQTQAVNFNTGSLTLVIGHNLDMGGDGSRNGVGKTAILNALSYGLYGDALTSIKKDNLINLTNKKNMLVTVEFDIDGNEYRIERGRRPQVLKFYVNGTANDDDEGQGENKETQKEIERIVGFPHEMFKHIVALNTYTQPFLSMRAADQRNMIEQLLGITDLSQKAEVLSKLLKTTKDSIKEEEIKINAINSSNDRISANIKQIERSSKAWESTHAAKLEDLATTIATLMEIEIDDEIENHRANAAAKEHRDNKAVLTKELDRLVVSKNRSAKNLEGLEHSLEAALNGVCRECGQGTSHLGTHEEYTKGVQVKIADEKKYYDDLVLQVTEIESALSAFGEVMDNISTFYNDIESALEHKHNLDTLENQLVERSDEINPYIAQIEGLKTTGLQEIDFTTMNNLASLRDHQDFLHKLLTSKDSFIRKKIINQNIAYLNNRLEYYLDKIGLPHTVQFKSDLNVEITEYGRELDFDNLSRGERNRLILSLSWAFRDIFESLNHPMNLMCVDELIDSGLDQTGVENALAILKKMNRDHGKNIMLVSHREELIGRVSNILTVVKTGGFTEYSTDLEYVD